jgi:hypothetical protein
LKNLIKKIRFQNAILNLFKPMQVSLQRKYLQKGFISNKVCHAKGMFENKFQKLFKVYSLILKGIILESLILFDLMQISPWLNYKAFIGNYFYL